MFRITISNERCSHTCKLEDIPALRGALPHEDLKVGVEMLLKELVAARPAISERLGKLGEPFSKKHNGNQ
eukprot:1393984-Amorphochlora_amoeboformis.AAC.1